MQKNRKTFGILAAIGLLACCALPFAGAFGAGLRALVSAVGDDSASPTPAGNRAVVTLPAATATPAPLCGAPPAMFILVVGTDSRSEGYAAGLADSMRIARIDFVEPGITYLTFQRDLYVEIPGISEHGGITHGKLNQAYLYGNSAFGYFEGEGEGPGLLAATLEHNFGTQVDHHVAINMRTFVRVIDALGGIDINLPQVVDGRVPGSRDPALYFAAGNQPLDGYRTLVLARMRPQGDFQRSQIQNLILQALAAKLLSPAVIPALPALIDSFQSSVQTDLGPVEIAQLLCLAAALSPEDITAVDFPENLFTGTRVNDPVLGRTFVWDVDFNILREYVKYFNQGDWPSTPLQAP